MPLNILPNQKKIALLQEDWFKRIRTISIYIVIVFVILDVIIIIMQINLNITYSPTEAGEANQLIESEEAIAIETKIADVQAAIEQVNASPRNELDPLVLLNIALGTINDSTVVSLLAVNLNDRTINVRGTSKDRESLAELQTALTDHPNLTDLFFPVGDLSIRENIDFDFTVTYTEDQASEDTTN